MKKAFSLFEITIVIVVLLVLSSFILQNTKDSLDFTNKTKIKSEIALIRNSIVKERTSKTLLGTDLNISLDDANVEEENSMLFSNILDIPLLSTTSSKKEIAKWIKISEDSYKIFITNNQSIDFKFTNASFICTSSKSLCREFE